ncbi:MAG TPA: CAP domain-containing protein [Gaiellaceae bacterium]|jgi:uncharacterized protein YkwD|nr:CAP domain-containing protein [Gaiellaceae bacterium]
MRSRKDSAHAKALVVALMAGCLFGSAASAAAATITPRDSLEPTLVTRINQVRAAHGLRVLRTASLLTSAATRHANSMGKLGYFRHELRFKSTWRSFGTWIHWYWPGPGYGSWTAGENLGWGAPDVTAAQMVNWWMNSPGHRANVLGKWRYVGVSIVHVTAPAGYYRDYPELTIIAAEFGKRS